MPLTPEDDAFARAWLAGDQAAIGDEARAARIVSQLLHEAAKPYPIPGPYEIALQVGAAAVQSGRFENIGAALHAAWVAVPEFYKGRDLYVSTIAPLIYGVSPPEGTPAYDQADDAPA